MTLRSLRYSKLIYSSKFHFTTALRLYSFKTNAYIDHLPKSSWIIHACWKESSAASKIRLGFPITVRRGHMITLVAHSSFSKNIRLVYSYKSCLLFELSSAVSPKIGAFTLPLRKYIVFFSDKNHSLEASQITRKTCRCLLAKKWLFKIIHARSFWNLIVQNLAYSCHLHFESNTVSLKRYVKEASMLP